MFRLDDFSPNTDIKETKLMVEAIREKYPKSEIWIAVSLFGVRNREGSVYPNTPFKGMKMDEFYDVDRFFRDFFLHKNTGFHGVKFTSHGYCT